MTSLKINLTHSVFSAEAESAASAQIYEASATAPDGRTAVK